MRSRVLYRWSGALLCAVLLISSSMAQEPDPFGADNVAAPVQKVKQPPTAQRIDFTVSLTPQQAKPGEIVQLTITGKPRPGFHTYPITQHTADQPVSGLSKLMFQANDVLQPLSPLRESKPEVETIKNVGSFLEFRQPFTWSQDVLISPKAKAGTHALRFTVRLQVCDATCVWGEHDFAPTVEVAGAAVPVSSETQARLAGGAVPIVKEASPPSDGGASGDSPAPSAQQAGASGLMPLLFASMGAAILMLLTPCVFPMIPITVSFFLKQSEKEHHNALLTACVYSLTIIIVLALAVLVLGQLIVQLANNAWLNLGLGAVLVFFALSLFGMYEIELPSGLARFTATREGQGGYLGAMFMALTFTITSFTCTGPFLGPLLVTVKEAQLSFGERFLGALCYSATFAAPFFVLALFPSLLKKLPRSGGWLNAVKVVMGFLELAAALKFLANTDLAVNPGSPMFFSYDSVLCAWIALSLLCGLYLLGVFRLPHDSPEENVGVARMLLASIFVGLAFYMAPALWRVTPQGVVGRGLVAFLPLDTRTETAGPRTGGTELAWSRDYEKAWEQATREGKLIFIDFTGQNCTNCRYNEKNVFPLPAVHEELAKYIRVQLYTDFVPDPALSMAQAEQQATRNRDWQSVTFQDITNPLYAVIAPAKDAPFETTADGKQKLKGKVVDVRKGLIAAGQVADFTQFLSSPLRSVQVAQVQTP